MRKNDDIIRRLKKIRLSIDEIKVRQPNRLGRAVTYLNQNSGTYDKSITIPADSEGRVQFTFTPDSGKAELNEYIFDIYKNQTTVKLTPANADYATEFLFIRLERTSNDGVIDNIDVVIGNYFGSSSNTYYIKLYCVSISTGAIA